MKIIEEAKAEDMLEESARLARFGQQQAKKRGAKTDMRSIDRPVHERRARIHSLVYTYLK